MFLSSIFLSLASLVSAAPSTPEPSTKPTPPQAHYTSRLQIGGNYTHVHQTGGYDTRNGNLGGAQGLYEYWADSHFYAAASLSWSQGDVRNGHGGDFLYIDTQERLGAHVSLPQIKGLWTFFAGLGYRHINQEIEPAHSIQFEYNTFYVPVGWLMEYTVTNWFAWNFNAVWMPQIFPTVWINPIGGANWSIKKELSSFLVEMPLDFQLTQNGHWHLLVTPFYQYWRQGASTARTSWGLALNLPHDTFQFCGVNVNFGYCF